MFSNNWTAFLLQKICSMLKANTKKLAEVKNVGHAFPPQENREVDRRLRSL